MNENARKWVAALRSGEYVQDVGRLRTQNGFCCLGVACDLYAKKIGKGEWKPYTPTFDKPAFYINVKSYGRGLPTDVADWLGFRISVNDQIQYYGDYMSEGEGDEEDPSLASANDDGRTFDEIADIIESEPRGLFHE